MCVRMVLCRLALACSILSAVFIGDARAAVTSPWNGKDIGSPTLAGDATLNQGVFTITAGGTDIWGTADQFHFVYQAITGDVDVRTRVDSVTMASAWSKAGVMIRGSLAADAPHGFVLVSAGNGSAFQRRTAAGGISANTQGDLIGTARWVRLVRAGTQLTAYSSADGVTWKVIGTDTVQLGATVYVGLAATSHNTSGITTATLSQTAIVGQQLPPGQSNGDIGAPAIKGAASYGAGTYGIVAGGVDIWGTSDQFHYVYQAASGDVDVKVRVASISFADRWSKAGVMIRQSLGASSAHALALVSAGAGYGFQRRPVTGGISANTAGLAGTAPGWVRLTRVGSTITAFQSIDGATWTVIGSDAIPLTDPFYVGIAVTSHTAIASTTAIVDSFSVAQLQPPANQPPSVALTVPAGSFTAPASITLSATASDPENQLGGVRFYAGSTLIGIDTTAPYSVTWSGVAAGTYLVSAVAYDAQGATASSAAVPVTVASSGIVSGPPPSNRAPSVSLAASGVSFTAPANITLSATASDPENQLGGVRFYAGATLIGTDTTAPYTLTWSGVAAGTYVLTAVAYDAQGATATSAAVTVSVAAATTPGTPVMLAFNETPEDAESVTGYVLEIFPAGVFTGSAAPSYQLVLGKPAADATGLSNVNITTFFNALPAGAYQATVSALWSGGSVRSDPFNVTR
jgi:regulation of enolase protein 1 (concanavalin A-like superfamily)